MFKKFIHAVFFYDNKRKVGIFLLLLAFIGCVANDKRLFTKDAVIANSSNTVQKIAYLTFDDGPSAVTEQVLDILKEENVKATFFLIGRQITEEREPIVKRMEAEGHLIGLHTYTHDYKDIYASSESYIKDLMKTSDRVYEVTEKRPAFYRFPWGSCNGYIKSYFKEVVGQLSDRGLTYYDWNVSAEDSVGKPTKDSILKNVRKDYKRFKEPVILMHDSSGNKLSADTLPQIIKELKEDGYAFATIDKKEKACQY